MPTASRLFIYSTFAVSLVYLLHYYRKQRRHKLVQSDLVQNSEHPLFSHLDRINRKFDEIIIQDLVTDPEYCDSLIIPATTVVKPKLTDGHLIALTEHNWELQSLSLLEPQLPLESTSFVIAPLCLTPETMQPIVSTLNNNSGSGSESDRALTPDSNDGFCGIALPPEGFSDPSHDIYEANPEEMDGRVLPRVLIPSDMWAQVVDKNIWHETFLIPAYMGGVLIGRLGKNVRELRNVWQAEFSLNTCPGKQDTLILKLSCPLKHKDNVLRWVSNRFKTRPSKTTIGNPNQLKRQLPLGKPVPVQIRSLYGSKEFFVTIPDEEYSNYLVMQTELENDYSTANNYRMRLCEPVTSGTVAVVPHSHGFARALIISVYQTWPKIAFYYLLDHGTFGVVELNKLRKIRAKYMQVPFQAIHVSWAHAFPVYSDIPDLHILRTFFNSGRVHAFAVRMETCCRASVGFGEQYSQPYSSHGFLDILFSACNSGLFMAVPLLIYPKRQSWLNGKEIPYYPFTNSYIDYQSLVTFVVEEDEGQATMNCPYFYDQTLSENHTYAPKHQNISRERFSKSGDGHARLQSSGQRRGQSEAATANDAVNRRQNSLEQNRLQNGSLIAAQKENHCGPIRRNTNIKSTYGANEQFVKFQMRKPLSNRNNSVSSSSNAKAISSSHRQRIASNGTGQ
ncbi:hypothetical protein EWB00_011310 [Schistosoma japonicum]|uniref:Tudor domain-containing protein n=2 Tax=Schistosoma japonicum TaxID=6182 RepID=A0A4Z2DL08_SCHJA|nr:hypothetical protein EWB00_011310 [Schistosoma japonicum]